MAGIEGHLDGGDWGAQASHGGAAAFIEATTTGVTEVLLEHLTRFEGFGAIFDDGFAADLPTPMDSAPPRLEPFTGIMWVC